MCSVDGRVVKAMDLNALIAMISIGVSPRRFESCSTRLLFYDLAHSVVDVFVVIIAIIIAPPYFKVMN